MSDKTPLIFSVGTETESSGEFRLPVEDVAAENGKVYFAKDADETKSQGRIYYDENGKRYVVTSFSAIYDDKSHDIANYYVTKPILTTNYTDGKYFFTFTNGVGSSSDYHLTDIYIDGWTWKNGVTAGPKAEIKRKKNGVDYDTIEVAAIPHATTTRSGVVTAADQTFKGIKTFQTQVKCGTGNADETVLDVQGNANINYGLGFQSNAAKFLYDSTGKTLTLSFSEDDGKFVVEDDTNIKENLTVTGNTTLGSQSTNTVTVNGPTTLNSTLTASGTTSLGSTLSVVDDTSLGANLEVDGATSLNDTLTVAEATTLQKTLGVSGNTTIGGTLTVTGAISLSSLSASGNVSVGGNETVTGNLIVNGNTTLGNGNTDSTTIQGALHQKNGHLYLEGATSPAASNTTQIIFKQGETEHIAISSNDDCFVINPSSSSSDKQIALYLGTKSTSNTSTIPSKLSAAAFTTTGGVTASGNGSFGGSLSVAGVTTLSGNLTVKGNTTLGDGTGDTTTISGPATINGKATLSNDLQVNGNTVLGDDATADTVTVIASESIGGNLDVTGATTLSDTLGVTGATTLSDTLDVTGATTLSDTLDVTGATTLSSTLGVSGATSLSGSLDVTGATTLKNSLNVQGNTTLGDSASDTVTIKGPASVGGTLAVTGATTLNSSLTVKGNTTLGDANTDTVTIKGPLTAESTLTVTGATNLSSLSTSSTASIGSTLTVTGASTLNSSLTVQGITTLSSTLAVTGATTLNSSLTVKGNTTLGDAATDTVTIKGPTSIGGTLAVTGNSSLTGNLTVNGNTTLGNATSDAVTITGTASVGSTLTVSGATTLNSSLTVKGNTVLGDATSDAVSITGTASIGSTLTVTGVTTLNNKLKVNGNTELGGTLSVSGATTLNSNLTISGNIVPSASITYNLGSTSYPWSTVYTNKVVATLSDGTEGAKLETGTSTTATAATASYLQLGNSITSGSVKNRYGVLKIFGQSSGSTSIQADTTMTSNYTLYLPAASGQIVYHTNDTTIGGTSTPVYVASSGQVTACAQPISGAWFQGVPCVTSGGVMEIGRYIDFHSTSANTSDYSVRIDAGTGNSANTLYLPDISGQVVVHSNNTQIGSGINPVYVSTSGNVTASSSTVGSGVKPIYLNAGTLTVSGSTVGSTTAPVYLNGGTITQGSTYAGGTKVTLNGTSCGASTATFYAPTGAGTSGYILKSNGSGAPGWAAVTNKSATLAWNTTSTIATIAGTDIKVTMPANPDTNTHHTAYLYATSSTGTSNASTTNGNTYLRLIENGSARSSLKITGSGATSVTSNTSGTITISSTNTTYSNATTSAAGLMSAADKTKLNGITSSADSVSFSRSLTSGTQIGTLTINGTDTVLYCQTNTNTNYYHTREYSSGLKISTGTGVSDMYVPNATASRAGVVSTGEQTFGGVKIFSNTIYAGTTSNTANIFVIARNTHGALSLNASTNRGIYDVTNAEWMLYRPSTADKTAVNYMTTRYRGGAAFSDIYGTGAPGSSTYGYGVNGSVYFRVVS